MTFQQAEEIYFNTYSEDEITNANLDKSELVFCQFKSFIATRTQL